MGLERVVLRGSERNGRVHLKYRPQLRLANLNEAKLHRRHAFARSSKETVEQGIGR